MITIQLDPLEVQDLIQLLERAEDQFFANGDYGDCDDLTEFINRIKDAQPLETEDTDTDIYGCQMVYQDSNAAQPKEIEYEVVNLNSVLDLLGLHFGSDIPHTPDPDSHS